MSALKAARAFTGRPKIAKVEGAYHGLYDYAEVSQTSRPSNWGTVDNPASNAVSHGTPPAALDDVVVIPFNDPERAIAILASHADQLACVLVDLMPHRVGLMRASPEFVRALYQWTRQNGALLVCDEVISFRSNYGGAQEWYGVHPDLTAMGKMIGGGFPVGAVAGRVDVMDVMDPWRDKVLFPLSGTFSANPITMTAGRAAMELFDEAAVARLNRLGELARGRISEAIGIANVPACENETRLLKRLLDHLADAGILMIETGSGALSTPMTEKEIDLLAEAMLSGLRNIKNGASRKSLCD
jgi:glutamate-1-semialdehyde 2,1-aminomutase